MIPLPEARVSGHLHDGPHDGETILMPWARTEIPVGRWEGDEWVESIYHLVGPWRGQDTAEYRHVPAPVTVVPPRLGLVASACLWLSQRLARIAEARS